MICPECKKERLQLAPFFKGGKAITMCAVCALKVKNEYHGLPEGTRFGVLFLIKCTKMRLLLKRRVKNNGYKKIITTRV